MKSFLKSVFLRIWAKKWRALATLVIIGGLGFWLAKKFLFSKPDTSFVNTDHVVTTGDVVESLSLAGTTQFANAQKLTFANKGRVTSVRTKIGAHVKKGDVLATITTDDLDRDVEKAKKELKNKQLEMKKIIAKSDKALDLLKAQSSYDLLIMQKQTLPSEQVLELQTKQSELQDMERQIKDKEKDLKEAQNDHAELLSGRAGATHAELSLSKNVRTRNTTIDKLVRAFRDSANDLQVTLDSYDRVMGTTEAFSRETPIFYIKNEKLGEQSKKIFWKVEPYVQKLNNLYTSFVAKNVGSITESELLDAYTIYKDLGNLMIDRGKFNYDMFLEDSDAFSRDKDSNATTLGTNFETKGYVYRDKYTDAVETLANLKDSDTTVEDSADKVEKLTIELNNLRITLQKKKLEFEVSKKQQVVSSAELDKKIQDAKLELEKAMEGDTQKDEIESIQNEIDNMQFNLTTLMKKYDEYKIIANFDGVVTKLDMQVGDSIDTNSSAENQKYIYVETPNLLEVKLEVDQIDIVKIGMGMTVQVFVDVFPDQVYSGVFSEIDTMPDGNSYKAKVVFQKNSPDEKILGGMSANVKVTIKEAKNVIVVPNPALADNERGEKIVRLKKGNDRVDQVVETGISDDSNTVILSGLKLGDTIKGFYMNETSMSNLGLVQGPSDGIDITTNPDGSMSYEYGG